VATGALDGIDAGPFLDSPMPRRQAVAIGGDVNVPCMDFRDGGRSAETKAAARLRLRLGFGRGDEQGARCHEGGEPYSLREPLNNSFLGYLSVIGEQADPITGGNYA
jgi:hypothetical protein